MITANEAKNITETDGKAYLKNKINEALSTIEKDIIVKSKAGDSYIVYINGKDGNVPKESADVILDILKQLGYVTVINTTFGNYCIHISW